MTGIDTGDHTNDNPSGENSTQPEFVTLRAVLILLSASLATASYSFTWNAVTIALPHMKGSFSATTDQITWVMIAFIVGSAMATASVSWFAGRFGRRNIFLFCIFAFTLTQFGCGLSTTLEAEVFWRFVQGLIGAPLLPITQVIAVNAFPKNRYTQATSIWALGFIAANVIAPTMAGYLVDDFGWPWVFYVTVPVSSGCFIAGWFLIPESIRDRKPMDWVGFLSLIMGIGMLQLMISRGERLDWFQSTEVIAELIATILLLYVFVVHTFLARNPFIDRALFRNWDFMLGQGCVFLIGLSMFLPLFLIPLQLQQLGGYPASEIGFLIMARGIGSILSLSILSRFGDYAEPRYLMTAGLLVISSGTWMMSQWTADIQVMDVFWANFVMGISVGSVWAPMNKMTLSALPKQTQDQGFAIFYLVYDIGSAIGTALIAALLTRHSQIGHALFSEHVSPFSMPLQQGEAGGWDISTVEGLSMLNNEVNRQAMAVAFSNCYTVLTFTMLAVIPLVFLYRYKADDKTS